MRLFLTSQLPPVLAAQTGAADRTAPDSTAKIDVLTVQPLPLLPAT